MAIEFQADSASTARLQPILPSSSAAGRLALPAATSAVASDAAGRPLPGAAQSVAGATTAGASVPQDVVSLSPAARAAAQNSTASQASAATSTAPMVGSVDGDAAGSGAVVPPARPVAAYQRQIDAAAQESGEAGGAEAGSARRSPQPDSVQLSPEARQLVLQLSQRDREVQIHEAAHAAVGGKYAGAPSLTYETGPDGKRYAVAGEVNIDMSEIPGDPAATLRKAEIIRAAALAPAQPSAQDRNVAAKAAQMKAQAQAELLAESAAAASDRLAAEYAAASPTAMAGSGTTGVSGGNGFL